MVAAIYPVATIVWGYLAQATAPPPDPVVQQTAKDFPPGSFHIYTDAELKGFLAAVKQADAVEDPLQRCLVYPDPPGSHWTHAAVVAFCEYHFKPIITFAQAKVLIEHGRSAELDREMAEALDAQYTQPDARDLIDHIYAYAFSNGSFDIRPTLDAWKRDSPNSPFAYAASGYAYVLMAQQARGGAYVNETPQNKLDAMDRLLQQADTDLQRAIKLEPRLTPAYVAMMHAGGMSLGRDYAFDAARQGLRVDPGNWTIYQQLMWLARPEWGGSLEAMRHVGTAAVAHAKQNPLLLLEKNGALAYEANIENCGCGRPPLPYEFPKVFDELTSRTALAEAGNTSANQGLPQLAVVYLSEAMRFQPDMGHLRRTRANSLAMLGYYPMALDDANQLIDAYPRNPDNIQVRASVYLTQGDYPSAEKDLKTALALNPGDDWSLGQLGNIYTNQTHEWDKAWDVADRIIQQYPNSPGGWVMRATIQETQPRTGLNDTYQYFLTHFGNDPTMKWQINHMRQVLAKTGPSGASTAAPSAH